MSLSSQKDYIMKSITNISKKTVGVIASICFVAGALVSAGATFVQHHAATTPPKPSVVTYTDCSTEEIPFETHYEGESGAYGYTDTIKQQGKPGTKQICKPNKSGYENKTTVITQPVTHIILRTPKPAPQPISQPEHHTSYRTGAICRDGWQSSATGRGACSHHGGVSEWLYSD
jgi:hypothetical protein